MSCRTTHWRFALVGFGLLCLSMAQNAVAQDDALPSVAVEVREADTTAIVRFDEFVQARQWDDALDALEGLVDRDAAPWVLIDETPTALGPYRQFVPVNEYANRRLASGPPELLERYRQRVDPIVDRWWTDESMEESETARRIVRQMMMCSRGDEALARLAEYHLERGELRLARMALERLVRSARTRLDDQDSLTPYPGSPAWLRWQSREETTDQDVIEQLTSNGRPALAVFPDSTRNPAEVWARLIWISISLSEWERATAELELFHAMYPEAQGRLMGTSGTWVELLTEQLATHLERTELQVPIVDWRTIGGTGARDAPSAEIDLIGGQPDWEVVVPRIDISSETAFASLPRLSDGRHVALAYHPIVIGDRVVWSEEQRIRAVGLSTGEPIQPLGETIDQDPLRRGELLSLLSEGIEDQRVREVVGVARYTTTTDGRAVVARLGNSLTGVRDSAFRQRGRLIAIDVDSNAALLPGFPLPALGERVEFDGCPIVDGNVMYCFIRLSSLDSARVSLSVCRFDLPLVSPRGELKPTWTMEVCEADTQSVGKWDERTHNLLSLDEGVLYVNSNLGVISAVESATGRPLWLTQYPRTALGDPDGDENYQRDLNPCVVHDDAVLVAPTDTRDLFALDRTTGRLIWRIELPRAQQILGATRDYVVVAGESVWWLDRRNGTWLTRFPRSSGAEQRGQSRTSPRGYGRGTMSQKHVYWPTHDRIFVFDIEPRESLGADGRVWYEPIAKRIIELSPRGVTGGNLVVVDGALLIAGAARIWAFRFHRDPDSIR